MREICQSGSMSGNRKQNQAKPDCGDAAKAQSKKKPPGDYSYCACSRLYSPFHQLSVGVGFFGYWASKLKVFARQEQGPSVPGRS